MIGRYYGPETLGIFNLVYAVYILLSQVAAGGVHISCLRHVAQYTEDVVECSAIVYSGLFLVVCFGGVTGAGLAALHGFSIMFFRSEDVSNGLLYIAPGLLFFAVNKVLMAVLNGRRYMKSYAVFQSLRYLLLLGFLLLFIFLSFSSKFLPLIFSLEELVLMPLLAGCSLRGLSIRRSFAGICKWFRQHFDFGIRVLWGGIVAELNTRADVLLLGYFSTSYNVGLYSAAAMLAEGFYQFFIVFRTNLNPLLAKLLGDRNYPELTALRQKSFRVIYFIAIITGALLIAGYPLFCRWFLGSAFLEAWWVLIILVGGIIGCSGYIAFSNILSQGGYPGWETILAIVFVGVNLGVGFLIIPRYDMVGAAVATALSFVVNGIMLRKLSLKLLGVHL